MVRSCVRHPGSNPGPLFTKKTPSYGYRDPHYKPKTVWRPSQVYNGNSYTDRGPGLTRRRELVSFWFEITSLCQRRTKIKQQTWMVGNLPVVIIVQGTFNGDLWKRQETGTSAHNALQFIQSSHVKSHVQVSSLAFHWLATLPPIWSQVRTYSSGKKFTWWIKLSSCRRVDSFDWRKKNARALQGECSFPSAMRTNPHIGKTCFVLMGHLHSIRATTLWINADG